MEEQKRPRLGMQGKLTGRVVREPSPLGSSGCKLTIPVNDGYGDKEHTTWWKVVAWKDCAESILNQIHEGDYVRMYGPVKTSEWTNSEGVEKTTAEMTCFGWEFLDAPSSSGRDERPSGPTQTDDNEPDFSDEDIPF